MNDFDPKPYCDGAGKFASQFGKTFSCKPEDINELEEILEVLHSDYKKQKISNEIAERIAVSLGIYLGQIMFENKLSECGYKWIIEENEPCLAKNDGYKMFPIAKVWKRITNDAEDSVKSFYDVGIAIAEGRFHKK